MELHISTSDGVPIYLQIANQVKYLVASGRLEAGNEIPPIRVLARQLLVNPNTVARAYLELERLGAVTKRQGSGTYVSQTRPLVDELEKIGILTKRVDALLTDAKQLDVGLEPVIDLLRKRDADMREEAQP